MEPGAQSGGGHDAFIFIRRGSYRHSMSSEHILPTAVIPIIRERQANGEDVHFYPLLLTPTPSFALDKVRDANLRPRGAKPFASYSRNDRDRQMSEAATKSRISRPKSRSGRADQFRDPLSPSRLLLFPGAPLAVP